MKGKTQKELMKHPNYGKEVAVGIHFDLTDMTEEQVECVRRAHSLLDKAGLSFDSGGTCNSGDEKEKKSKRIRDWDWSLSGPVRVTFRNFVEDDSENRYWRETPEAKEIIMKRNREFIEKHKTA